MEFMNRASLHLALYESAYATTPKMVETTVSEVPKVGFKIPIGHVKRVMKNPFTGDGTKSAREHVETIEDICGLFSLPGISDDQIKMKLLYLSLSGNARIWFKSLDEEVTIEWISLRKVFLKYFTPKERILAATESTNILQEEDDKSLSLGMPVQPQEDDENISLEAEVCEEEIEMDVFQPKLGEELDLPASPSTFDSSTQTQKSFVIYENSCYDECQTKNSMVIYDNSCYYDETNNAPLLSINATSELIDDNAEYCLNMLYDNALDDGTMLIDKPPCLVVTKLCEDKNDILPVCDVTLTHESPTLFLDSPNNTIEEKFAYVEKYLCGLQLPLVPNLCCNHDIKLDIDLNNYFERGKYANKLQNKFNDSLYVPKLSKLEDSIGYVIKYIFTTCNYYEKGGDKNPLYATNNYGLQVTMHWKTSIHCDSFIYKIPMHRKKVRLRCYYFCVLFFSLLGFNRTIILIGLRAPWDPGIMHGTLSKEERHIKVQAPS